MTSQQNTPNDKTPTGSNNALQTPAPKVTRSVADERHQGRVAAAGNEEGTSLEFESDAVVIDSHADILADDDAAIIDSLADILADKFVNEYKKVKKVKNPACDLLMGLSDENVGQCWNILESYATNDVDVDAAINYHSSPEDLANHAKQHEVTKERGLRPAIPLTQKLQESLASHREDDNHLRQAITTTQNVEITNWFNCRVLNRPEDWLRSDDTLGARKGVYLAAWGIDEDLHFHNYLRVFQSEEYQNLSKRYKAIFARIIGDAFREDLVESKNLYLRLKVGKILDEYLFQRAKNFHQSQGQFARMRFISTYDLCDDKVTELEDLIKYTCSRVTRRSHAGMVSCIAGVNSEVFYTTLHFINDILVKAAEEFVKKGTFTATFTQLDESGDIETVTIKETDRNENSPQYPHYREFCLKSDRKYHKNDCVYKSDNGDVHWQAFSRSLKIHCKCSPFYEEPEYVSDLDEEWVPVHVNMAAV